MPREGSPWTGCSAVFAKELADHLSSMRMRVLEWLVILTGLGAVYVAVQSIKVTSAEDPFLFLRLFTHAREPLPSFVALVGFLIPLMAIGLGFDSVNSEFNRRTMSRVLSQPLYRDALLFGKLGAALATLTISMVTLWLLVFGLGLVMIGVPPSDEEVLRALCFLVAAVSYGAVWLAMAMLFSITFRSAATSAMCAIGLWLLFAILWPILVPFVVQAVAPSVSSLVFDVPDLEQIELQRALARISPGTLFMETALTVLHPTTRALGPIFIEDLIGSVAGAPLRLSQSLLLVWPQITGLVAAAIALLVAGYVAFQRQEVRA